MAHFYGIINGSSKSSATRCGTRNSGLETVAASWNGAVRTTLYYDEETQTDMCRVELTQWQGQGTYRLLYSGPVNSE